VFIAQRYIPLGFVIGAVKINWFFSAEAQYATGKRLGALFLDM
jgi:hypothetical protein